LWSAAVTRLLAVGGGTDFFAWVDALKASGIAASRGRIIGVDDAFDREITGDGTEVVDEPR